MKRILLILFVCLLVKVAMGLQDGDPIVTNSIARNGVICNILPNLTRNQTNSVTDVAIQNLGAFGAVCWCGSSNIGDGPYIQMTNGVYTFHIVNGFLNQPCWAMGSNGDTNIKAIRFTQKP